MDVSMYLNTEVDYEEYIGNNNRYLSDEYKDAVKLKCRLEGNLKFVRDKDSQMQYSEQTYWSIYPIKVKDKINGQYVRSVNPIYEFDGSIVYYEVSVW